MLRYKRVLVAGGVVTHSWTSDFADGTYREPSFGDDPEIYTIESENIDAEIAENEAWKTTQESARTELVELNRNDVLTYEDLRAVVFNILDALGPKPNA